MIAGPSQCGKTTFTKLLLQYADVLFEWNKQVFDAVCEKAISYYDTYATEKIKSLGN